MFRDFLLKKIRCFEELRLEQLARVNLITGKNNTGKTALLEAIHLHNNPAKCAEPVNINKCRGITEPAKSIDDILSWLFHDRQSSSGLEVSSNDTNGLRRIFSMWILDAAALRETFPEAEGLLQKSFPESVWGGNPPRLVMRYQETNAPDRFSVAVWGGAFAGLSSVSPRMSWSIPSVYLSSAPQTADQDIKFFGELEAAKRQDEVLPALRIIEPRLQRLSLLPLAGELTIHGDIGLSRLVPIPFMGEGLRRLLSLVLAIANARGGVVLIDEIENGLHYSVQKQVWQAVALAARKVDAQVFATTHSYECIRAAHEALAEEYDFRLHRLDRIDDEIRIAAYDQETLETALELAHEVR